MPRDNFSEATKRKLAERVGINVQIHFAEELRLVHRMVLMG